MSKHPLYSTWWTMHNRCSNPKRYGYKYYGGRGIKVCERWSGPLGLKNFVKDMGERPDGTTIDRIDNDGDYEPGNCQWSDIQTQNNNTARPRYEYEGKRYSLMELARLSGVPRRALWARLHRGWTVEDAVTTPVRPHTPKEKNNGAANSR